MAMNIGFRRMKKNYFFSENEIMRIINCVRKNGNRKSFLKRCRNRKRGYYVIMQI